MDTFWPNFLAETGWPGLVMMFLIIAAPLAYSLMMAIVHRDLRRDWLPAFLALLFLLAISPTSTSFQDPGLALIPFVLFGVAVQRSAVHRQEVQP